MDVFPRQSWSLQSRRCLPTRRGWKHLLPTLQEPVGRTPLHLACANGHTEVVTFLVRHRCQLDAADSLRRTPLMTAVQFHQEDCVSFLLEHGADPNLTDTDGHTALHLAIQAHNKNLVGLLLRHFVDHRVKNKEGFTPLALAVSEGQEEIVEILLKAGVDVHARDQHQRTPLMIAASVGQLNLVKVLLSYGANISHEDADGRIAEDYADLHGYWSLSQYLAKVEGTAEAPAEDAQGDNILNILRIPERARAAGELEIKTDLENTGEAPACDTEDITIVTSPEQAGAAPSMWGAPAVDRGATDDLFEGGSVRSSDEEGNDDTWSDSEESIWSSPKEALAQLQMESHLLHQLLENLKEQQLIQGSAVTVAQGWFNDIFHKLRAAAEKQAYMLEEFNKELKATCAGLREQVFKYEADKVKREGNVRELQQKLAEALKNLSGTEASLEVATRRCRNLEEANLGLEKELGEAKSKGNVRELQQKLAEALKNLSGTEASLEVATRRCRNLEEANLGLEKELGEAKSKGNVRELQQKLAEALKNLSGTEASLEVATRRCRNLEEANLGLEKELGEAKSKGNVRELQQKLAEALKNLSGTEASLEVATRRCRNLEEANLGLEKELGEAKSKLQELEEQHLQCERCIRDLKTALENKEREVRDSFQRLEGLLLASSERITAMKHLEERVQCLEAESARLEGTVQQQSRRIEALLQGSSLEQAASQDRLEQSRAHDHDAERKLLLCRIGGLEQELESKKYTLRENIVQIQKYEQLYLEEVKKRRCLQNELESADVSHEDTAGLTAEDYAFIHGYSRPPNLKIC
ncbi:ankyrin repeat domain-containing protein 18B-like isoform X3 [Heliangelus exortis]|uniref:ankyrin repeat domain-containing protein 18B-like isoform X3 n=1 Tax=Heliangelus exortis TaxID=472823 RepID=UPI003A95AF5A